jgi:serine/threonine protein kinase
MENNDQPEIQEQTGGAETKLIGNGKFGCVFHPGILCNKKMGISSSKIVSKVQLKDDELINEIKTGSIIKKIPHFNLRFAPILSSCSANLSSLTNSTISKCDIGINRQNAQEFISSELKYAGSKTLSKHFLNVLKNLIGKKVKLQSGVNMGTPTQSILKHFIMKIIKAHIYLLESLQALTRANIIHFDLKENNIIYDDVNDVPIVIDFGHAVDVLSLKNETNSRLVYKRSSTYRPWCIEIALYIYVYKQIFKSKIKNLGEKIGVLDVANLKQVLKLFIIGDEIGYNRHYNISSEEIKRFETKTTHYINMFLGKSWKSLIDSLVQTAGTWDNYSMAQIFYYMFHNFGLLSQETNVNFIKKYLEILKKMILVEPGKRMSLSESIINLKSIMKHVSKQTITDTANILNKKVKQPGYLQDTQKRVNADALKELYQEKAMA